MARHTGFKREVGKHQSRHAAILYNVPCGGDNDRGNAVFFEIPGDQTHGLVAHGSDRRHHRNVDLVFSTSFQHFRCIVFEGLFLAVCGVYAVALWRNTAQATGGNGILQRGYGEICVDVIQVG